MSSSLWYQKPAGCFEEALPIGAGRFGAMLYGAPECELLRLNEDSVWSGGPRSRINPDAASALPQVRALILQGRIADAQKLAFEKMQGCTPNMRHYMPLGDCSVRLNLPEGDITDYRRSLDLETAVYSVSFTVGNVHFQREIIASYPDQCLVVHMTADAPFDAEISMDGRDDYYDENQIVETEHGKSLRFTGGSGTADGIRFICVVHADAHNGIVSSYGNTLTAADTQDLTLVISMRTGYYHPNENYDLTADQTAASALKKGWHTLLADHIADYQALYRRSDVHLPTEISADDIPTDALLAAVKQNDLRGLNTLLELYFRYGRYLMIAGSRPGSLPLNLQGIWNVDMWPAWGSRFTININTEMNYWGVESCNLSECHLPLFNLLEKVRVNGTVTAREMYGCRGFCCHHNTDLWGDTAPQDLWMPATIWAMGGAWLTLHVMEHYRYTLDRAFLEHYFPLMRDAALFFTDYLIENDQGQLITVPSVSPENTYRLPNGETGSLCAGPSMDTQIITELYHDVIDAAAVLGKEDDEILPILHEQLARMPKPQIGQYGQIMEWAVDYEEKEPGHRHVSQLFALHPAHQISPRRTPELAEAAAATLRRRLTHGGGHTGWSCAWISNMYARLNDPENVFLMLKKLMQHSTNPNLFDMHPPFQIDGNFGGSAAIAECLLRSEPDGITLLPACPSQWHTGAFTGLCTYGGFTVSAEWSDCRIIHAEIRSKHNSACRVLAEGNFIITDENQQPVTFRKEADGFVQFETVCGGVYHLMLQ